MEPPNGGSNGVAFRGLNPPKVSEVRYGKLYIYNVYILLSVNGKCSK